MKEFVEKKLNKYAEKIIGMGATADEFAYGELTFYIALRRVLNGTGTPQDLGMMDAVNDVLQEGGVIEKGKTFIPR